MDLENISLETLGTYLPATIVHYLSTQSSDSMQLPLFHQVQVAVLFADISGFTTLSEHLSGKSNGTETLAKHLNSYFEQLSKIIGSQGGDIFKFAGDALLVLWPEPNENIHSKCKRATQTALQIQKQLHNMEFEKNVVLSLKIGIGSGTVQIAHVGGVLGRIEYFAMGDPVHQAFQAEKAAISGDIVLSAESWDLVQNDFNARMRGGLAFVQSSCSAMLRRVNITRTLTLAMEEGTEAYALLSKKVEQYIPGAILPYLQEQEERWASELRQLSIMFIDLGLDIDTKGTSVPLEKVQNVIAAVQTIVYQYQGSLNKFLIDEKGAIVVAVFGLCPLAHENDASRAVKSSLCIVDALAGFNCSASIGVTTGTAFCGVLGSRVRREYSVLGDVVNLSARLMQIVKKDGGGVLCDEPTKLSATSALFCKLGERQIKGKTNPVCVYRLESLSPPSSLLQTPECVRKTIRIYLPDENGHLTFAVHQYETLFQVKEKTLFHLAQKIWTSDVTYDLDDFSFKLHNSDAIVTDNLVSVDVFWNYIAFMSMTKTVELDLVTSPLSVMRSRSEVKTSLLLSEDIESPCDVLVTTLNDLKKNIGHTVLIEANYGMGKTFMVNSLCQQRIRFDADSLHFDAQFKEFFGFSGDLSDHSFYDSIQRTIEAKSQNNAMILFIDSGHMLSNQHWIFISYLSSLTSDLPFLLIVALRPMNILHRDAFAGQVPEHFITLEESSSLISLEAWSSWRVSQFIKRELHCDHVSQDFLSLIEFQCEGNPLHLSQITSNWLDNGFIVVVNGTAGFSEMTENVPLKVHCDALVPFIIAQLDRLPPKHAKTLKVASVIGDQFTISLLCVCLPSFLPEAIEHILSELCLLRVVVERTCGIFEFASQIIRSVLQIQMLESQRQQIQHRLKRHSIFLEDVFDTDDCLGELIAEGSIEILKDLSKSKIRNGDWKPRWIQIRSTSLVFFYDHFDPRVLGTVLLKGSSVDLIENKIVSLTARMWSKKGKFRRGERVFKFRSKLVQHVRNFSIILNLILKYPLRVPKLQWENFPLASEDMQNLKDSDSDSFTLSVSNGSTSSRVSRKSFTQSIAKWSQTPSQQFEGMLCLHKEKWGLCKRFVQLTSDTILIYKHNQIHESICLIDADVTRKEGMKFEIEAQIYKKHNVIRTTSKVYEFEAISVIEANQWVEAIEKRIQNVSPQKSNGPQAQPRKSLLHFTKRIGRLDRLVKFVENEVNCIENGCTLKLDVLDAYKKIRDGLIELRGGSVTIPERLESNSDPNIRLNEPLTQYMRWEFDAFKYTYTQLEQLACHLLYTHNIFKDHDTVAYFVGEVRQCYRDNAFHCFRHAVDVMQMSFMIVSQMSCSKLEKASLLLAALCHDIDHPGVTNQYLISRKSSLALLYNDRSVLEQHHCSMAFQLILKCNLLDGMRLADKEKIRTIVISCILSTDLASHDKVLLESQSVHGMLNLVLHAADIGNPCRPLDCALQWSDCLMQEFAFQREKEISKGMIESSSPFPDQAQLSIQFMQHFVLPVFEKLKGQIGEIELPLQNAYKTFAHWKK